MLTHEEAHALAIGVPYGDLLKDKKDYLQELKDLKEKDQEPTSDSTEEWSTYQMLDELIEMAEEGVADLEAVVKVGGMKVKTLHKVREYEAQRHNVTPREFWGYVKREYEKKTGQPLSVWFDDYNDWATPFQEFDYKNKHKEWGEPCLEVGHCHPFEFQIYLQGSYNCILEFEFWDDKKGWGYAYITEFED